jgi:hypothetical protein
MDQVLGSAGENMAQRRRIEPDHGVAILLALIERDRHRVVCHGLV